MKTLHVTYRGQLYTLREEDIVAFCARMNSTQAAA
jgi:hypothetical protein